ncbi:MAG TPA: hypothetical protein VIL86_07955, partial [Tepidisphaeraceae bacterium]
MTIDNLLNLDGHKTKTMTSRERFVTALLNGIPDRVPVAPDISNYLPAKRTGLPYWDIYLYNRYPLWQSYLETADYFGMDAWIGASAGPSLTWGASRCEYLTRDEYVADIDAMVRHTTIRTPDGDMTCASTVMRREPPSPTEKPMKDLAADWKKWRWRLQPPTGIDHKPTDEIREQCRKRGHAFGLSVSYPGFQIWNEYIQDGIAQLSFAIEDHPEILQEWYELELAIGTKIVELTLSLQPDYILFGGSGTITLSSPELARRFAIPPLALWTKMCKDAGVPSMLHSCGKSRVLVDMLADETDMNCINPLEIPPMGDVILAEVKAARGLQIALMGNLHTTQT